MSVLGIFGVLPESWRWLRRRMFGDPPPGLVYASAGIEARVDHVLADLEREQPTIHRLRQIPMDLIAEAVAGFLGEAGQSMTDAAIRYALQKIASRNQLGPLFVQDVRL